MHNITPFGEIVRKLRLEHKCRLKDMADAFDVSPSYISAVETGKKNVSDRYIEKVSSFFNLDMEEVKKLKEAVEEDKSSLEVDLTGIENDRKHLAFAFARKLESLSGAQMKEMKKMLDDD